jgi:hypothetical protein
MINHILATATDPAFTKGNLLAALLTVEGLLFAAFTVSVSLANTTIFGSKTIVRPTILASSAAAVLAIVASAAALTWVDLFTRRGWPESLDTRLEILALLFAIVVQPAIAVVIALGTWRG